MSFWRRFDHLSLHLLGDDVRKGITISTEDILPLDGSRGEANFIIKWPYANDQAYIKIIDHKTVKKVYTEDDSGEFVTILAMECRSVEPIAWHPSLDFAVVSTGGTPFENVDLSDRDWAEFDEEHDLSVSITDVEYKIELASNK